MEGASLSKAPARTPEPHTSEQEPVGPGDPPPPVLRPVVVATGLDRRLSNLPGRSAPQSPEAPGQGTGRLYRPRVLSAGCGSHL